MISPFLKLIDEILIFVCCVIIGVFNAQVHLMLTVQCVEMGFIFGPIIRFVMIIVPLVNI